MYTLELYWRVRQAHYVEGKSIRQVAREFNQHRHTINKMLECSVPPRYQRQQSPLRPKLDPYTGIIDQILQSDQARPRKQRHTAQRIFPLSRHIADEKPPRRVAGRLFISPDDSRRERWYRSLEAYASY